MTLVQRAGLREALEAAHFEPDSNVCATCHHEGAQHDLNNRCLIDGDYFASFSKDALWDFRIEQLLAATPPADDTLLRRAAQALSDFLETGLRTWFVGGSDSNVVGMTTADQRLLEAYGDQLRKGLRAEPEARELDVEAVQAELDAMYPDDESDVRAHIANIETILGTNRALTVKEAHAMFEATDSARLATTEPTEEQPR